MPVAASNVTAPRHSPVEDDAEVDEERLRQFTRAWKEATQEPRAIWRCRWHGSGGLPERFRIAALINKAAMS